jgi:uncharacterized membrane protein YfcA
VPSLIVLALIGLAAQMVDGSLGMAYGVTSSTLLVAWGVSPAMASGSVHLAEMGTTLVSGLSHWRFGNVDWGVVLRLGIPGAIGAYLGASVLSNLSTEAAIPFMAGLLMVLGAVLLVRFAFRGVGSARKPGELRARFLAPLGVFAGFVDASGGGGWGPVATPTMLVAGRTTVSKVIGSVSASEFLVSTAASLGFLLNLGSGGVNWSIAIALMIGGAIAAPFAAWLVSHVAPRVLGTAVGGLILLTNMRTLLNHFGVGGGVRSAVYLVIAACWATAVVVAIKAVRRERQLGAEPVGVING